MEENGTKTLINYNLNGVLNVKFIMDNTGIKFRVTTPHSNSLPIGRENKKFLTIRSTMRFRGAFGLFGLSENSSFPSTLRAWFAFAHSSPYRKSNRNDKRIDRSPPCPSPSWGIIKQGFAIVL